MFNQDEDIHKNCPQISHMVFYLYRCDVRAQGSFSVALLMDLVLPWAGHWQQVCCTGVSKMCCFALWAPQDPCAGKGEKHRFLPTILHLFTFSDTVSYDPYKRCVIEEDWIICLFLLWLHFIRELRYSAPAPQPAGVTSYPTAGVV